MPAHARTTGREWVQCALFNSLDGPFSLLYNFLLPVVLSLLLVSPSLIASFIIHTVENRGGKCLLCLMLVTPLVLGKRIMNKNIFEGCMFRKQMQTCTRDDTAQTFHKSEKLK